MFWGKKVLSGGVSWWFSGLLTAESVGKRTNFGANGYTETGLEHKEKKDAWTFYFSRMRMEYYFPPWKMCSVNFMLGKLIKKTPNSALVVQKQPAVAVCGNHGGDVSVFIVCECVVFFAWASQRGRDVLWCWRVMWWLGCVLLCLVLKDALVHFNVISILARRAFSPVWLLLRLYLHFLTY